jgi:pectinesterase
VIQDCDLLSAGNDTLSLWRGRAQNAAEVAGQPPEDETLLKEGGRYYHARLRVEGSVDFICPRGWCYLVDSTITQVNPGATAAIWHDGSGDADKKFVLRGCRFDGPASWYLARRHHDGQFFLLDCTFSERMRDRAPYRVIYPLNGGTASETDVKRNRELDQVNRFGDRNYFHHTHRVGGDYPWHRDNLATAPGAPKAEDITARWTFAGTWDPERADPPAVIAQKRTDGGLELTWSERVTVKGQPRLKLPDGTSAQYVGGSGTRTLRFAVVGAAAPAVAWDFSAGLILASEAGATLRTAASALSSP